MQVKVKKLHQDAVMPIYATTGAGAFDLCTIGYTEGGETCRDAADLSAEDSVTFRTGLAFEIPEGHVMYVFSRSGHGFMQDVRLANCVGVIDSDYRGEVMVKLVRESAFKRTVFTVRPGDRIAQAVIMPVPKVEFVEADDLTNTERGAGGFGSTGA